MTGQELGVPVCFFNATDNGLLIDFRKAREPPDPFFEHSTGHPAVDTARISCDITVQQVDAIVNAANHTLMGGGGVDGAIHRAAGPGLREACRSLGRCETGAAKLTEGFDLPARFVIHTVGPIWQSGDRDEPRLLASCYHSSLKLAVDNGIRTVAFPSISTGAYRFPLTRAVAIAVEAVQAFLAGNPPLDEVRFVCLHPNDAEAYYEELQRRGLAFGAPD